jgi:hypothetical protein
MRYRVLAQFMIEAPSDAQANAQAKQLNELLKLPMVRLAIGGEGIRLADGDGRPVVYAPQREGA